MMSLIDWIIVAFYMLGMVGMSAYVGRRQCSEKDYYLGGNKINVLPIALSTMATQCSTNSLLGAPAFVIAVGGLLWLQYELAVPLAMIGIMLFLLPFFRKLNVVSVYEYLEYRFGPASRTVLSLMFQFLRAFSTGVTVYGISLVITVLLDIPLWSAILALGVITVIYDYLGGMQAVIYSDVIQMVILYAGILLCLYYAVDLTGGWAAVWEYFPDTQSKTLDFSGHGLGDGKTFAFLPMLFGGFFLYLSYYGCDQTQVQRELSTATIDDTNMSLFLGGILRFPLVVTYCLLGVAIGAYAVRNPAFLGLINDPSTGEANYNLAVPAFCLNYLPRGAVGLIIVSLFAAAMSSLDSTINSLSATTMRDIVHRYFAPAGLRHSIEIKLSRLLTIFWGILCVAFSFFVADISASIIETINMIGSLINGPILATFLLATLTRRANDKGVVIGIVAGFAANLLTWRYLPGVSWLWWNVSGCLITFTIGFFASLLFVFNPPENIDELIFKRDIQKQFGYKRNWYKYHAVLVLYFVIMIALLLVIQNIAEH